MCLCGAGSEVVQTNYIGTGLHTMTDFMMVKDNLGKVLTDSESNPL